MRPPARRSNRFRTLPLLAAFAAALTTIAALVTGTGAATAATPAAAPAPAGRTATAAGVAVTAAPAAAAAPTSFVHPGVLVSRPQLDYVRGKVQAGAAPVGFNALHHRMGIAMTNTQTLTESRRPAGTNNLFVAWETLTHADNPDVAPGGATPPPAAPSGAITGIGGKCVDVAGASPANGAAVQLYDCNGTAAQTWTVTAGGTLQALGKCMDVTAAGTANGTKVQLYDCNGTGSQVWQPGSAGSLVNPQSGKCLDATGQSSANGTRLQIWSCTGTANQSWTLPTA